MVKECPAVSMYFSYLILDCLLQRIKIPELLEDEWFKKGYKPASFTEEEDVNVDDVAAAFVDSTVLFFEIFIFSFFHPLTPYLDFVLQIRLCSSTGKIFFLFGLFHLYPD